MHVADHYYHVYNRGCNRARIFANDGNYVFLLRRAKTYLAEYPLALIAYCLMPNHYHFLLRPEADGVLSRFIQRLFNSYSQAFNKQQNRSGRCSKGAPRVFWLTVVNACSTFVVTYTSIRFRLAWYHIRVTGPTATTWSG